MDLAISYGKRLSDSDSGATSFSNQTVENAVSSSTQDQLLKDYIFSLPALSDVSITLGEGSKSYLDTKTDEVGAIVSPSWFNVLMAKKTKLGKVGSNRFSQKISSSGGAGSGGQEPDDEESRQRKIREDSDMRPALEDSPYHPKTVGERIKPPFQPNPAHELGSPSFNSKKTPEPPDSEEVYENAIRIGKDITSQRAWSGFGREGIYWFFDDNANGLHFSGIMENDGKDAAEFFEKVLKEYWKNDLWR